MNRDQELSRLWICVEDGLKGTENQLLAVAEHLATGYRMISIRPGWVMRLLAPYCGGGKWLKIAADTPAPNIILGAGRQAVQPCLWLKKQYPDAKLVFLQDPKWMRGRFDLIAAPAHDALTGKNIVTTHAAPTSVTPERARVAADCWPDFADMPRPVTTVLIGGNSKTHSLTPDILDHHLDRLGALPGSLLITASRRSGAQAFHRLGQFAKSRPNTFVWDGEGENPYMAMLGHADRIVVTQDSVSMISDATSTGKPVFLLPLAGGSKKFTRFYDHMSALNAIRPFDERLESEAYQPLTDAETVAEAIKSLK